MSVTIILYIYDYNYYDNDYVVHVTIIVAATIRGKNIIYSAHNVIYG